MKKLVLAFTIASVMSLFADDPSYNWVNAKPTDSGEVNYQWTGDAGSVVTNTTAEKAVWEIDADPAKVETSPTAFVPAEASVSNTVTKFTIETSFEAIYDVTNDEREEKPINPDGSIGAIIIGGTKDDAEAEEFDTTNYYAYIDSSWKKLEFPVEEESDPQPTIYPTNRVTVGIEFLYMNGVNKLRYSIDGVTLQDDEGATLFAFEPGATQQVHSVQFVGNGKVASIAANVRQSQYFDGGAGTEADPFVISDDETLKFELLQNPQPFDPAKNYLKLGCAEFLTFDDEVTSGLGTAEKPFAWNLDGDGKTIYLEGCDLSAGFFGTISNATIKSLTLDADSDCFGADSGIVVFAGQTIDNVVFNDCTVAGDISCFGMTDADAIGFVLDANASDADTTSVSFIDCCFEASFTDDTEEDQGISEAAFVGSVTQGKVVADGELKVLASTEAPAYLSGEVPQAFNFVTNTDDYVYFTQPDVGNTAEAPYRPFAAYSDDIVLSTTGTMYLKTDDPAFSGKVYASDGATEITGELVSEGVYSYTYDTPSPTTTFTVTVEEITDSDLTVVVKTNTVAILTAAGAAEVEQDQEIDITWTIGGNKLFADGTASTNYQYTVFADYTLPQPEVKAAKAKKGEMIFLTLQDALDNADAGTVSLLADTTLDAAPTIAKDETIDLNGYTLTFGSTCPSTLAIALDYNVTIINSAAAGGLLNRAQITIAAGKTLDCGTLKWGVAGGLIATDDPATTTASFTLNDGSTLKLGDGPLPTEYKAGFIVATKGAKFYTGSTVCYYNGTSWGTTPWAGSGTELDPYQIASEDDLFALKDYVDAAKVTSGVYFKQTANIAMTKVWYGIGKNTDGQTPENPAKTDGKTFSGVYDGNGKTVSNILFSRTEYQGFFNTISNGVVKALTLATVGYDTEGSAGCGGGVLVGVAYDSTFDHIVINGSAINATHNASAFAVKAHYTTFTYCTNNAEIASTGNKRVAGFVCFNSSLAGGITFEHCANNGNLSVKYNSNTDYGIGGFVGVAQANGVDGNIVFTDCVNKGTITQTDVTVGATELCCGSFVGGVQQFGSNAISATGCSAQSGVKSVGFVKAGSGATLDTSRITGLGFATVADGVATFNAAPVNGDYVMFDNAAATIALNTTLTLNESVATNSTATITVAKYGEVARAETATADVYDYTSTFKAPWAGEGTAESPYEIAEVADLTALKEIVDDGLMATVGVYFEQQNEIDFASAGEWEGIGPKQSEAKSFQGTYDGQGFKIKNVQFVGGKYMGFFRSIKNATIKNLTIATTGMTCLLSDDEGLGIFVGYEYGTLNSFYDCVAEGTVSVNHTAAGFVCGGGAPLYFSNCVNKATLTTTSSKAGGFVGINTIGSVDDQFIDCRNEGDVTGNPGASGGLSGFYGYLTQSNHRAVFTRCVNTGVLTATAASDNVGAFVGLQNSLSANPIINNGGCVAQASYKPCQFGGAQEGFTYATVADEVATYIPDADLVKDTTYTLKMAVTAEESIFTLAALNDTFILNTNGLAFAGTVDAAAGLTATPAVEGSTITWTATSANYTVTFSTNGVANVVSAFTLDNVESGTALAAAQVPSCAPFTGGSWDVNPVGAVITCNTNFNYTLSTATPIAPGEQKELDVDPSDPDAEAKAQAEAAKYTPNITDQAAKDAGQAAVVHTVAVYNPTSGKYVAEVQINTNATDYVAPEAAMPTIATKLTEAAAASGTTSVTLSSADVTPGLYYTIYGADNVNLTDPVNEGSSLATSEGVTLTMPKVSGNKAFFKVSESMTSVPANK